MIDSSSYSDKDLLVFDLRNGRVGGLTFCRNVETWFEPWETFEIHNEASIAAEMWSRLPQSHKDGMRFVWGHGFSNFRTNVGLDRSLKIISLVRHPLLKVSGLSIRENYSLMDFDCRSMRYEFDIYIQEHGVLPTDSLENFLSSHFFVGITELMEESLFLFRERLGVRKPIREWDRIGSHADPCSNIYARGAVKDFVCQPHYSQEISYYLSAKARLLDEIYLTGLMRRADFVKYKAICQARDAAISKWGLLYPELFSVYVEDKGLKRSIRKRFERWAVNLNLIRSRSLPASPSTPNQTRMVSARNSWTLWPGDDDVEHEMGDDEAQEFGAITSSLFSIDIRWPERGRATTNLIRVELELPSVDRADRWVDCAVMGQPLFRLEVGSAASHRCFDIPVSHRVAQVHLTIGPDDPATSKDGESYARIRKVSALSIPLNGEPARTALT